MSKAKSGPGKASQASPPPSSTDEAEGASSRIAQAGRRLRDAAAPLLQGQTPPQRRPGARKKSRLGRLRGIDLAAPLSEEEKGGLVELTDADDRPLVCMAPEKARQLGLFHRRAVLALRGPEGRVFLHRGRDPRLGQAALWDLYTSFVMVGEAGEDAVLRLLRAVGLPDLTPRLRLRAAPDAESRAHRVLFTAEAPRGLRPLPLPRPGIQARPLRRGGAAPQPEAGELLEVDAEELAGLTRSAPELFSPEALWAEGAGALFDAT
jgi:hypothetical protein